MLLKYICILYNELYEFNEFYIITMKVYFFKTLNSKVVCNLVLTKNNLVKTKNY